MSVLKFVSKSFAGMIAAMALTIGSGSTAFATEIAQFTITNNFGATISLDTASCTGGTISPPLSIANGATSMAFSGTTTGTTTLCTVRYQSGTFGCQFVVQANGTTGFTSANAYKGSGGRPVCTAVTSSSITGGWSGTFTMK